MENIKLTIGIPTYNGANTIRESIDSLVCQLGNLEGKVEILVSDNASTDDTEYVIREYIHNFPSVFSYYKNNNNLGYDLNVDNIFKHAKGDYIWLLGDDDIHYDGSLEYILEVLKDEKIDIISVNFDFFESDMKTIINKISINDGIDIKCGDHNEFLRKAKGRYGNLSAIVLKKNIWNSFNKEKGIGCQYLPVYVLMHLLPNCISFIVTRPLLKVREGSVKFENSPEKKILIPLNGIKILKSLDKRKYDKDIYNKLLLEQREYVLDRINQRTITTTLKGWNVVKVLVKYNYNYLPFWSKLIEVYLKKMKKLFVNYIPKKDKNNF